MDLHSKSDSAVPGYLYQKYGDTNELWNSLDGIFACVILDERTGYFCAARDPIGICSLYWGRGADGSYWFSSELKAIQTCCEHFDLFPPVGGVGRDGTGQGGAGRAGGRGGWRGAACCRGWEGVGTWFSSRRDEEAQQSAHTTAAWLSRGVY